LSLRTRQTRCRPTGEAAILRGDNNTEGVFVNHPPVWEYDFDELYRAPAPDDISAAIPMTPWDIGEPQPVLIEIEAAGGISGKVLDVGCGLGDNAIFLAGRGYDVRGVDGSAIAIDKARQRARDADVTVEFAVADAVQLAGIDGPFNTIVDMALFHCLSAEQRLMYAATLHRVTAPDARLQLVCCSDAEPGLNPVPATISEPELRTALDQHWDITDVRLSRYTAAFHRDTIGEILASPLAGMLHKVNAQTLDGLVFDDAGRLRFSAWQLTAHRR
jgi:SAM-dependent methyltransferase